MTAEEIQAEDGAEGAGYFFLLLAGGVIGTLIYLEEFWTALISAEIWWQVLGFLWLVIVAFVAIGVPILILFGLWAWLFGD